MVLAVFKEDNMIKKEASEPKPGSQEAVDLGCTCPVIDNHHGAGMPMLDKSGGRSVAFWISADCPLHGIKDGTVEE